MGSDYTECALSETNLTGPNVVPALRRQLVAPTHKRVGNYNTEITKAYIVLQPLWGQNQTLHPTRTRSHTCESLYPRVLRSTN